MNKKGFTLIEVLLVVVIIAILAGITIVAINPGQQISDANDTQRTADVKTIVDAVSQYRIDNRGDLPANIPVGVDNAAVIGDDPADDDVEADICGDLVPTYVVGLPTDPTAEDLAAAAAQYTDCTDYYIGYTIYQTAEGRVFVTAPDAEGGETIEAAQ